MSWLLGALTVVAIAAIAAVLMLGAIRRTVARQQAGLPPLPACPPPAPPLLEAADARYLGTTFAPSSIRRFSGHGLLGRRTVGLAVDAGGLRVDRGGAPWCIPAADLRGLAVTSHHAGKEVYAAKVLVVDWQLGPTTLRSGFVLDEAAAPRWAAALAPLVAGGVRGTPRGSPGETGPGESGRGTRP